VPNQRAIMIAAAVVALALISVLVWSGFRSQRTPTPGPDHSNPGQGITGRSLAIAAADMATLPADVRDAANRLLFSRVGYAMTRGDRTFLVISTGSDAMKIQIQGAEAQPSSGEPAFVDVRLRSASGGDRLLVASIPVRSRADYQFTLDGALGAIPSLHNQHNLPLITLPMDQRFAVITPTAGQMVEGHTLLIEGYGRVFEAAFTARLVTQKGRTLAETYSTASTAAPNWGSFRSQFNLYGLDLPDSGFLILEEEITGAKTTIPVRFRVAPQMG